MVRISFINYGLTAVLAFSGFIAGIIVSVMAEEELKDGKTYFIGLSKILLITSVTVLLYFLSHNLYLTGASLIATVSLLYFYSIPSKIVYPFLAIVFALSYGNVELFFTEAVLIFLYGLPAASLAVNVKKKNYVKICLERISFVIVSLLLFVFLV